MGMLIWAALSACAGYYGRYRRFGFIGWFIIAFMFSPFVAFIALYASTPKLAVELEPPHERREIVSS